MEFSETSQQRHTDVTGGVNDNFKAVLEKLIQDQNKNRHKSQIPIIPPRPKETENPLQNISCTPSISRTGIACPSAPVIVLPPPPSRTKETQRTPENVSAAFIPRPLRVPPPPPVPRYDDLRPLISPPIPPPRMNSLRSSVPPPRTNDARQINQNVSTLDFVGLPSVVAPRLLPPPTSHHQQNRSQTIASASSHHHFPEATDVNKCAQQEVVKKERFSEADVDAYMSIQPALAALNVGLSVDEVRGALKEKLEQTGCGFASGDDLIRYVLRRKEGSHQASVSRQVSETDILVCLRSELVLAALNLGFSLRQVEQAIKDKLERTGCDFASVDALIEAALNLPEEEDPLGAPPERNKRSDEDRLCIICMNEEICVVFVPCGHLRTCPKCSENLKICPLCRRPIELTVRTFLP